MYFNTCTSGFLVININYAISIMTINVTVFSMITLKNLFQNIRRMSSTAMRNSQSNWHSLLSWYTGAPVRNLPDSLNSVRRTRSLQIPRENAALHWKHWRPTTIWFFENPKDSTASQHHSSSLIVWSLMDLNKRSPDDNTFFLAHLSLEQSRVSYQVDRSRTPLIYMSILDALKKRLR